MFAFFQQSSPEEDKDQQRNKLYASIRSRFLYLFKVTSRVSSENAMGEAIQKLYVFEDKKLKEFLPSAEDLPETNDPEKQQEIINYIQAHKCYESALEWAIMQHDISIARSGLVGVAQGVQWSLILPMVIKNVKMDAGLLKLMLAAGAIGLMGGVAGKIAILGHQIYKLQQEIGQFEELVPSEAKRSSLRAV